jgi:hypothetical protein
MGNPYAGTPTRVRLRGYAYAGTPTRVRLRGYAWPWNFPQQIQFVSGFHIKTQSQQANCNHYKIAPTAFEFIPGVTIAWTG